MARAPQKRGRSLLSKQLTARSAEGSLAESQWMKTSSRAKEPRRDENAAMFISAHTHVIQLRHAVTVSIVAAAFGDLRSLM